MKTKTPTPNTRNTPISPISRITRNTPITFAAILAASLLVLTLIGYHTFTDARARAAKNPAAVTSPPRAQRADPPPPSELKIKN